MIELRQLKKNYGSFTAVDSIDLEVPDGQLFGFLGPNGAGKTTTLRMIAGILQPTSGSIHLAGIDLAENPLAAKAKLGFIPDRPFIYEKLTGAEFLREPYKPLVMNIRASYFQETEAMVEHLTKDLGASKIAIMYQLSLIHISEPTRH